MTEIKILTPIGMLGYGFPEKDYLKGLSYNPDAVILDGGSTDPGPYMLGLGETIVKAPSYEKDLSVILKGIGEKKIPLIVSSVGGAGSSVHIAKNIEVLKKVLKDLNLHKKIVVVDADIDKEVVKKRLAEGKVVPCDCAPELTVQDIDESVRIVAQMGAEPILKALQDYPDGDIFFVGRAYDPSPYAAYCMYRGINNGGVIWHMGKIMECGAVCAEPKGAVILATVRDDSFDLEPMADNARCTTVSTAAHTLYEKTRPDLLPGPGGVLDLTGSHYKQISERAVRVSGSKFVPSEKYQIKLEGAAICGYRTIFIAGVRDPILISQLDNLLPMVKEYAASKFPQLKTKEAEIHFHVYGKNGVMGKTEPCKDFVPLEVGILCEVTARTQELASAICSIARIAILHGPYKGQLATAGNVALPLNPQDNALGPVCRFSVYHLMEADPLEFFPAHVVEE